MPMMPQMGPPAKQTWEEIVEQLRVNIENGEKSLLMQKAQLKEAETQLSKKEE